MTHLSKAEWDVEVNRLFVNNTEGDIEADEVRGVLNDLGDSITFGTQTQPSSIRSFSIQGQDLFVDPGTELSGQKTFLYNVARSSHVSGNLTLAQGASNLLTNVSPTGSSVVATINTITLNAGENIVFTLSGVDNDTNNFSRTFTVTARNLQDFIFFGVQLTNDASTFDFANQNREPFVAGSQSIIVPTFANNQHLVIAQRASEPDLGEIVIGGTDQIGAFTKTSNAFLVNSINFDAWVSNKLLQGPRVSGNVIRLER